VAVATTCKSADSNVFAKNMLFFDENLSSASAIERKRKREEYEICDFLRNRRPPNGPPLYNLETQHLFERFIRDPNR
jgi:hypothetical protein